MNKPTRHFGMKCPNCGEEAEFDLRTTLFADGGEQEWGMCLNCGKPATKEELDKAWEDARKQSEDASE